MRSLFPIHVDESHDRPRPHVPSRGSGIRGHEIGDDRYVYLEVEGVPPGPLRVRQASYDRVAVPVPVHIWEHARRYPDVDLSLADATDDELRADVEAYVDERIARYEAAGDDRERAFASVIGSIGYGPADAPREEQVAHGMEGRLRRRAYEREVRAAIEQLVTAARSTD